MAKDSFEEIIALGREEEPKKAIKKFKVSCSSIHKIMGVKGLGKTGESYLKEWVLTKMYSRKKDFFSLFVEKGLRVEPIGIQMLSEFLGIKLEKNDEWVEDEYVNGFPDIILPDMVTDVKCPWSIFTFPFFDKELPNDDYDWQVQGYMSATGLKKASVAYTLIDTPKPLIDQELKKLYFQSGGRAEDWQPETYADLAENYKFSDIPLKDKVRIFEVKRDEAKIKAIHERVKVCREVIKLMLTK